MTFAKSLEHLKAEHKKSISEIARYVGVSRTAVYNWLDGAAVQEDHVVKLAEFFGVTPPVVRYGSLPLDVNLLAEVIADVAGAVVDSGRPVTPETQAGIIALAYEQYASTGERSYQRIIEGVRFLANIGAK